MSSLVNIFGYNTDGSKCLVLHAQLSGVTSGTSSTLSFPGFSIDATWIAPQSGAMFAISGAQKAAASAITLNFTVNVNGTPSGFGTTTAAFTGAVQTFSAVAGQTYPFNAGDRITISATPSAPVTLGFACLADVMVII